MPPLMFIGLRAYYDVEGEALGMEIEELKVEDIMTSNVVTVGPEASAYTVAKLMADNKVGSVVVVDEDGNPVGIITEGDLISRVLARRRDPERTRARDIMSQPLITVEGGLSVREAADLMARKGIGHLPVVKNGKLVGIVAEFDIVTIAPDLLELIYIRGSRT